MRRLAAFLGDERAVSSAVTHALALGISVILIAGLFTATTSLVEDQRERSAEEELRTVGNRLANELVRASFLAQEGGNVSIRTRHPTRIGGHPYHVSLVTGSDCDTKLFTTETCLDLEMANGRTSVTVPVRNVTPVALDATSSGTFTISATRNVSNSSLEHPSLVPDYRVGIGADVDAYSGGTVLNLTNRDPISGFTLSPGQPTVDSVIRFQNDTKDLDGIIADYEWELGDGTTKSGTREFDHSYATPGKYTVSLTVTDDDGETDNVSKVVSVGGLVLKDDATPVNVRATNDGIRFSVENKHTKPIEIQELLVDPADDDIEELDAAYAGDEIEIDGDVDGGGHGQPIEIYDGGRIFDIDEDGSAGAARLSAGSTADVWFRGFEDGSGTMVDMTDETVFVAMRYEVDGQFYTSHFTLGDGTTGNEPPEVSFTHSCTDRECEFDPSGSSDDGTIDDFQWDFGDGNTSTESNDVTVTNTYGSNGTYDVSLTVTDDEGVTSTLTKSVVVGGTEPVVVWAVNSGGNSYTDDEGITYDRDTDWNPHEYKTGWDNNDYTTGSGIANTSDDPLYQSERYGDFGYDVPVANGEYEVTVKLAEVYWTSPGQRRFDIELEGSTVVSNLDIYAEAGAYHAIQRSRTVTVSDGTLDIWVDTDWDNAKSSAVVVKRLDAEAYQENDGDPEVVSMEAESHMRVVPGTDEDATGDDMSNDQWTEFSDASASGGTGVIAEPDNGHNAQDTENGERLDYYVDFDTPGTYNVWVRMDCSGGSADSVHVGLNGTPASYGGIGMTSNDSTTCASASGWMWASDAGGDQVTVDVDSDGLHTVNLWMREDGTKVDKIVLKKDAADPTGTGPDESDIG